MEKMEKDTMEKDFLRVPEITQKTQIEESFYMDNFSHTDIKKLFEMSTMDEIDSYETEGLAVMNVIPDELQCTTSASTSSATVDVDKKFPNPQYKQPFFMDDSFHPNMKGSCEMRTMGEVDNYETKGLAVSNVVPDKLQCMPTSTRSATFNIDEEFPKQQNKQSLFKGDFLHSNVKGSCEMKTIDEVDNYETEGLAGIYVVPDELQCTPSTSARSATFDIDNEFPKESDANNGSVSSSGHKIEALVDVISQTYLKVLKEAISSLNRLHADVTGYYDCHGDDSDPDEDERYKEFSEMMYEATIELRNELFQYSNTIFLNTKRLEYLYNIVPEQEKLSTMKELVHLMSSFDEYEEDPLKVVKSKANNSINSKLPGKKVLPQYKRKKEK